MKELKLSIIKLFRELDGDRIINLISETRYPDEINQFAFRIRNYYIQHKNEIIEPNLIFNLKTNTIRVLNVYDENVVLDFIINPNLKLNKTELMDNIKFELDRGLSKIDIQVLSDLKSVVSE